MATKKGTTHASNAVVAPTTKGKGTKARTNHHKSEPGVLSGAPAVRPGRKRAYTAPSIASNNTDRPFAEERRSVTPTVYASMPTTDRVTPDNGHSVGYLVLGVLLGIAIMVIFF